MIATGAWICLLAPLAGFVVILLAGSLITRTQAGIISTVSVFVGFAGALASFFSILGEDPEERSEVSTAWTWLAAGGFKADLAILVDPLSLTMMLIVTGVGGLIVLYSTGYMKGDDEERRYFAYMSLFVFSMLMLVQGGNLLLLLVGWGLVGLASYLLIGFHHDRPSAIAAAKKAFVINAIGDAIMALGLFLVIAKVGSLDYSTVFEAASSGQFSSTTANLIALGLLGGAAAKSAQIPFHTWLPDAMEGPTPVSALIHAATMVTAGVYLICRTHDIFEAAPRVQHLAAILGLITLLVAGLVALVQWDIKRVIAYSTMSQIGYMFVAAGIGAYGFAMFHLMTHAFFKALLFLSAGLVIHHLDGEQDIRKMGGLRKQMPYTHAVFLIGTLALVGIPPLAGFWSKDAILAATLADGSALGYILLAGGLVGAFLTALYSFRLYFKVFHGEPAHAEAHGHEAHHGEGPQSMILPVGVLAFLSVVGGLIEIPGLWNTFVQWLEPVVPQLVEPSTAQDYLVSAVAVTLAGIGFVIARSAFQADRELVPESPTRTLLEHKFYFDELYDAVFSRPYQAIAEQLRTTVEDPIVQGSLDHVGPGTSYVGGRVGRLQGGALRAYALVITGSIVVLTIVFLVLR